MLSPWEVWLILSLDNIVLFFFVLAVILFIVMFPVCAWILDDDANALPKVISMIKKGIFVVACLLFMGGLIPNTKQAVVIYMLPKIVNNEQVQRIPDVFNQYMKDWLDSFTISSKKDEKTS